MFTRIEKMVLGTLLAYLVVIACLVTTYAPSPGASAATSYTLDGYPIFMETKIVSDLADGHYTIYKQSAMTSYVIHHQPGDKDFMYVVAPRFTDDLGIRKPSETFTVYRGRIITPPEGPTFRAV